MDSTADNPTPLPAPAPHPSSQTHSPALSPSTALPQRNDTAQQQHNIQQQQHEVDTGLSSIVAFNASYNSAPTNEWGKRPADSPPEPGSEANKRPHIDNGMTLEEEHLANQVQAHIAATQATAQVVATAQDNQQVDQQQQHGFNEEDYGGDEDDDPDYQFEEEEHDPDEDITAALAAAGGGGGGWDGGMGLMDPGFALWDANQNLRIHSLPILDNLSSQILQTLGKGPYQETINIVTQPESGEGQAYNTMKSLFDQTKKLYTHEAFLSADELKLEAPDQRSTIRKVNLATFVSSVFGSQEVGFFHLNEHFLDTFVPDGGRLLKSQGSLYLDLKTQAYISAMSTNERTKEEILEDLFPNDMARILLSRRPGAKQLTPSEQDFVARLQHRRQHLMCDPDDDNLGEKYVWQDFLKEVSWYVSKNHEMIVAQPVGLEFHNPKRRSDVSGPRPNLMSSQHMMAHSSVTPNGDDATTAHILAHHNSQHQPRTPNGDHQNAEMNQLDTELFGPNTTYMGAPPLAQPPIPQQSQPTQVLYERARLAATSKSSPNARRAGLPSQRRPWTTEEENALMAGLDRVKGPHWSQILAMFGPGGTVSEALKDRNQVQLKDKARNLKLFFLKSGIEVPYYLQFVTGELKTRAPGQAAKNAAKKAVEASAEEDAAHVAAVTALGNAHREQGGGLDTFGVMPGDRGSPDEHDMNALSLHGDHHMHEHPHLDDLSHDQQSLTPQQHQQLEQLEQQLSPHEHQEMADQHHHEQLPNTHDQLAQLETQLQQIPDNQQHHEHLPLPQQQQQQQQQQHEHQMHDHHQQIQDDLTALVAETRQVAPQAAMMGAAPDLGSALADVEAAVNQVQGGQEVMAETST